MTDPNVQTVKISSKSEMVEWGAISKLDHLTWNDPNVCPIYKSGCHKNPGNYRPVSLTFIVIVVAKESSQ